MAAPRLTAGNDAGKQKTFLRITHKSQKRRRTVGRGKVEIQNQDSHFPTAQNRLRRKEKNGRLHKTVDAPIGRDGNCRPPRL
jgi:hypothetical protein